MKKKVLVTYQMFRSGYAELMEKYDVTFPPEGRETFTYDEVYQMLPEYDALQSMFNFPVSRELLQRGLPRLRIVSNYAVGYDNRNWTMWCSRPISAPRHSMYATKWRHTCHATSSTFTKEAR